MPHPSIRLFLAATVFALPACHGLPGMGSSGPTLPPGRYRCYTYHPSAILVGALEVQGNRYDADRGGAAGTYRLRGKGRVDFLGQPPLGFRVGILEEREPVPKLRLYIQAGDVGNKWKAAVCTGSPSADGSAGGSSSGAAFTAGARVEATFMGYWYAATVVRCAEARCLLHYDDPSSKDEWVDTSRLRVKR
jgi:hypothetical protein